MNEIWNLSALCRCCHVDGDFKSLEIPYQHRKTVEVYSVLLRETLGISISPPPFEASYSICDECIVRLRDAHRFRTQVLECEQKFHEYCQNEQFMTEVNVDIKKEVETDSDGHHGCDDGPNDSDKSFDIEKCKVEVEIGPQQFPDQVKNEETVDVKKEKFEKDKKRKIVKKETSKLKTVQTNNTNKHKGIKKLSFEYLLKTESGEQYVCLKCGESCLEREEIRKHIRDNHKSGHCCLECSETFKSWRLFKKHFTVHSKQFRCSLCRKEFGSISSLKGHLNSHTKMMKYTCDLCKKDFMYKNSLSKHMLWHMGKNKKWMCETCGHSFNDQCNLKIHIDVVHFKVRKYVCKICSVAYSTKKSLVGHLLKHKGIKSHNCTLCPAGFYSWKSLAAHKLKHEDTLNPHTSKRFTCKTCSSIFNNRSLLVSHIKKHRGTRPHICPICFKDFSCQYTMKRHIETHSGVKRHECDICHKKFSQKMQIARHKMNVHEKVKPTEKIKCDICKVWVFDLQKHLRCHTDRPFACHLCEKNYSAQNSLNRHISNDHFGRRVFKCNLCPKGYTQNRNLVKHKLKAHKVVHKEEENYDEAVASYAIQVDNDQGGIP